MGKYILRRLLALIPTTIGVLLLTFVIFHVIGGSPAEVVLGKNATPASLAAFDAKHGYDLPLLFGNWAPTRAIAPMPKNGAPLFSTNRLDVPLAFALSHGTYRLSISPRLSDPPTAPSLVGVTRFAASSAGNSSTGLFTNSIPCSAHSSGDLVFDVPQDGHVEAMWIDLPDALGATDPGNDFSLSTYHFSLRRRTRHFFDSQFVHYMSALLRGDLGDSTEHGAPVTKVLRDGVWPSLALTVPILVFGTIVALCLGLAAALWRAGGVDRSILFASTALMSINYVVWVVAGQYLLAFKLRLFPIWGFENWTYLLLPVIVGVVSGLGRDIRFFRAVFLDELHRPYVRTAIAKGLSPSRVLFRHVLRNSMIPLLTYVSLSIPFLFTGSVLLESFFGIPGLGCVSLNAIHSSDMAVVRAVVIIGAILYQVVNLLADLAYAWLDPRVRIDS